MKANFSNSILIIKTMLKSSLSLLFIIILLASCNFNNQKPAYRFSNFYDTEASEVVKAIESNDIYKLRKEIELNKSIINFRDTIYETSLLSLAIINDKKEIFQELLKLGADVNIKNSKCSTPLKKTIIHLGCDGLEYIKELANHGAKIHYLNKNCNFIYSPILDVILFFNDSTRDECCIKILDALKSNLEPEELLKYNNSTEYENNIVYFCLSTGNFTALKYLIVDLQMKYPKKIYVDKVLTYYFEGESSFFETLNNQKQYHRNSTKKIKEIEDILSFMERKNNK